VVSIKQIKKQSKNLNIGIFKTDYFLKNLTISIFFSVLGILLIHYKILKASEIQVLIVNSILLFVFSIIAIVFNLIKHKLIGIEGFYFLFSSLLKIILITGVTIPIINFKTLENQSLLILFLFSYLIFALNDIKYKIRLLKV
jgi:hypothetical protein